LKWCEYRFLRRGGLDEALAIRKQLYRVVASKYCTGDRIHQEPFSIKGNPANIRKALAQGFFNQTAIRSAGDKETHYLTIHKNHATSLDRDCVIHTHKELPQCVMYNRLFSPSPRSRHIFMQNVTAIESEWVSTRGFFKESALVRHNEKEKSKEMGQHISA
jgi:hypothetical protein